MVIITVVLYVLNTYIMIVWIYMCAYARLLFIIFTLEGVLNWVGYYERLTRLHGGSVGMASIRLEPPELFNFKQPDEWPNWKRRFEQYSVASEVAEETEFCQASTLLWCMGSETGDVLASTKITEKESKRKAQ